MGGRQNAWNTVWNRFAEAPFRYMNLPNLLRKARPAKPDGLLYIPASWPQENEAGEAAVRAKLLALDGKPHSEVWSALLELDKQQGARRDWVWEELGFAPLADALPTLLMLAESTATAPGGATPTDIATTYTNTGWRADASVLEALAGVETGEDVAAVKAVIRTLYLPWLQSGAEALQKAVAAHPIQTPNAKHSPGRRQRLLCGRAAEPAPGRCAYRERSGGRQ